MALINTRFQVSELNELISDKTSCIKLKSKCKRRLALMPADLDDLKVSIKENLDTEVSTYDEGLGGIILSFKNVKVHTLSQDDPGNTLIPVDYIADVYIFSPKIGSVLSGIVNKKGTDHIGCLVHKIFNVTIPCPQRIPTEEWEGNSLNIGDEVTFKIVYIDLCGRLPYIKGSIKNI